jgi:hypothetical protein
VITLWCRKLGDSFRRQIVIVIVQAVAMMGHGMSEIENIRVIFLQSTITYFTLQKKSWCNLSRTHNP